MKQTLFLLFALFAVLLPASRAQVHAHGKLYARAEGRDVQVAVDIEIDHGWHVYHGPTAEEMGSPGAVGTPTTVALKGTGFSWSALRFQKPTHSEEQDFGPGEKYTIFEHVDRLVIYARGKIEPGVELSTLAADVDGLTCQDSGVCVPYKESLKFAGAGSDSLFKEFAADLVVGGDKSATAAASEPAKVDASAPLKSSTTKSGAADSSASNVAASASTPKKLAGEDPTRADLGLLAFLVSAVGWALFTLLMPCTYPMIPITISYFTKQASQRKTSVLPLSLCYGAGIVLIFVLIGVTIGPLIIPFATHPVTNLVIGGFFLLFALALFGVVNLQPPAALMNLAGTASSKGGYAGVFLMGATLVITSFTCTAPFVGTLLSTGASSGDLGRVALGMAVFGATMAIPFVFLSLVPDRVKAMPRSGEWMHTLKVTLGFVEIAAALKFLSNVDLVWQWGWLSRELFLFLWLGIFLTAALYLFGLIKLKDEATLEISPGRMVAGLLFFLFSIYCGFGALGNSMDPIMSALIPPYSSRTGASVGQVPKGRAIVEDDYATALARAKRENKGLLVNFTGFT